MSNLKILLAEPKTIDIGGRTYGICFPLSALAEIEEALGEDYTKTVSRIMSAPVLLAYLRAGLRAGGLTDPTELDGVVMNISPASIPAIADLLADCLVQDTVGEDELSQVYDAVDPETTDSP